MKVYIEVVILDNLLMTAAISEMSYYVCGVRGGHFRVAAVSVLGTTVSVLYPFFPFPAWLIIITKIAVGIGLSAVLFFKKSNLVRGTLNFFLMTALAGGLCVLINYLLIGNLTVSLVSAPVMPYCACAAIVILLALAGKIMWNAAKKKRLRAPYLCGVALTVFGKSFKLKGFIDSGNTLFDNDSGFPVIVVKLRSIESKLDSKILLLLLSGKAGSIDGVHYISANSLGGEERLPVVRPEKIELYSAGKLNTNNNVMLGVSVRDFGGDADILLSPAIIGG